MTHKELIDPAYRWVLKSGSCGVAFKELVTLNSSGEIPDVIGFGHANHTVMIECKASRGDFLADRKKPFRIRPELGMGRQRFYCCPTDLIKKSELPFGWGLIYVNARGRTTCVYNPYRGPHAQRFNGFDRRNVGAERSMMYSALRRLQIRGRIIEIYDPRPE